MSKRSKKKCGGRVGTGYFLPVIEPCSANDLPQPHFLYYSFTLALFPLPRESEAYREIKFLEARRAEEIFISIRKSET
nr:MAG TPA: hypothetical protein [Caudoviricetes sp.]